MAACKAVMLLRSICWNTGFFSRGLWKNEYLIYLSCDVSKWKDILEKKHKRFSAFYESDLGNKLTAISIVDTGEMFRELSLIRCGS